jgi:hypothetical protein
MTKESLLVLDRTIPYTVRVSEQAKRLRVAVYLDGDVIVTKPKHTTYDHLKKFVESKRYWIVSKLEHNNSIASPDLKDGSAQHFTKNEDKALKLVTNKVEIWAKKLGYEYGDVCVKQLKSRWGSCSSKGNLTFNYKVLFLDDDLRDYVVVHELCHIAQPNHSRKFWNLVEKSLPNYEQMRSTIKTIY